MAVNLVKHKDALLGAWRDVLDNKTATNWALFGYEGVSNDLKFISKGSEGIDELIEDLNSGKIMYAFLQVTDPKTSLPKNVLINWQGEGAPTVRKGTCANHVRDVTNFFKGAHVTINARTEEEVDRAIIIEKVSKSTGSVYKFNERTDTSNDAGPVGTAYKRTIPKQEINSQERDKFWEQQEEEERQRQASEKRRSDEERRRAETERKLRDSQETAQREAKILEASKNINQIRLAEKAIFDRAEVTNHLPAEDLEKEELERRNRSDILRRQRSEEAQSLIAKRTVDARAVFEHNSSAGQLNQRRSSVQTRAPVEVPAGHRRSSEAPQPTQGARWPPQRVEPTAEVPSSKPPLTGEVAPLKEERQVTVKPIRNGINGKAQEPVEEEQEWEDEVRHEFPVTRATESQRDIPVAQAPVEFQREAPVTRAPVELEREAPVTRAPVELERETPVTRAPAEFQDPLLLPADQLYNGDFGLTAKALYDYQAADETEITFDPGDLITHIDQIDEGWWQGLGPDGTFGLFPANYVELIK